MSLKIVRGKNLPIGADLGSSMVKLAQLRYIDGGYELLAADAEEIPHDCRRDLNKRLDFLAESIRRMLDARPFQDRRCVLSLPAEATFVNHLKIPCVKDEDIPKALKMELQGKLPYDVNDAIIQHVVANEQAGNADDDKLEVIAICVNNSVLKSYLDMSQQAKLDVIGVNIESCAMVECFSRLFRRTGDANRTVLFVDIGSVSTQVAFAHGEQIVFAHNLRMGGTDIDHAVAEGMQISLEEAHSLRRELLTGVTDHVHEEEIYRLLDGPMETLGNELDKCLRYYESAFRNRAIELAIFLGGQAYDKRLCQCLAKKLNVTAQIGDPLVKIKRAGADAIGHGFDQRGPKPDWAVAVGLSIGANAAA